MPSENWALFARLWLLLLAGWAAAQAAPQPAPDRVCHTAFLRGYKLKGLRVANQTEPFLICPQVGQNCCSKRDQLYIYHYLRDVLPPKLTEFKMRRDLAFERLRGLHRRLIKTQPNFRTYPSAKADFCTTEWRKLFTFDFEKLNAAYMDLSSAWEGNRGESMRSFFCALCDGKNHAFFDPLEPSVTIQQKTCQKFMADNKDAVKFWLGDVMAYLINLQNVVDCNHYTVAFNLTFFDPARLAERTAGLACMRAGEGEFKPECRQACNRMGLASVTPFVDGDPAFLEEVVNLFGKFNFHQETGRFVSMQLRQYFRQFEMVKQLNETEMGVFRQVVSKSLEPVMTSINVVDAVDRVLPLPRRMSLNYLRDRAAGAQERRLRVQEDSGVGLSSGQEVGPGGLEVATPFRPSNSQSEPIPKAFREKANQEYQDRLRASPSLLNSRRLQAASPTNATAIKKPKIDLSIEDQMIYDQIGIEARPKNPPLIFQVATTPLDLDKIPRKFAQEDGMQLDYTTMDLEIDPKAFHHLLYRQRPPDKYDPRVTLLLDSVPADIGEDISECLKGDYFINADNFYIKSFPPNPARKLDLRRIHAADLLKEVTAKG